MALLDWVRSLWKGPTARPLTVPPVPDELDPPPQPPPQPRRPPFVEVERLTLHQLLRSKGPFTEGEATALGFELCRLGLLEPGPRRLRLLCAHNLFFTPAGALACLAGTPRFSSLSPEEVRGQPQDERTDVFDVAVAMHTALLGRWAIGGETDLEMIERVRSATVTPLPIRPTEPLALALDGALRPEPDARTPASLAALADVLRALPRDEARLKRRVVEAWRALTPPPAPEPAPPDESTEGRLLERVRAGDDGARLVYADLLESQGRTTEAEWVRLEQRMRGLTGSAQLQALTALRKLAVPLEFMASVSRPDIETCAVTFGFRCPRTWDALTRTADPLVRFCSACDERVYFAATFDEADEHAEAGRCVALPETVVRGEGRLGDGARNGYLGRGPRRSPGWKR